jgi:Methyltransferase domain
MLKRIIDKLATRKHKGVSQKISVNDLMYKASTIWYMYYGKAALDRVLKTWKKAEKRDVQSLLDLPSGHGRELRFFKAHFPEAKIVACDIDKDGVDFCAETFGVEGIYSHQDIKQVCIPYKFDIIWCGSLVTHLDKRYWRDFLQFFCEHLNKNGLLIFSTHGSFMIKKFRSGKYDLGIDEITKREMLKQYDQTGFSYGGYSGQVDYGISLSSKEWVDRLVSEIPDLELFDYVERGWFHNHDTVACRRSSEYT